MLLTSQTQATEILNLIRTESSKYKTTSALSLNALIAHKICWVMFNGLTNVFVTEDEIFMIVEIFSIYSEDIIDRYKFAKVFI